MKKLTIMLFSTIVLILSSCVKKLDYSDLPPMLMVDCNSDGKYMEFNNDNLNASDYQYESGIQGKQDDHFIAFSGTSNRVVTLKNGGTGTITWSVSNLPSIGLSVSQSFGSLSSQQSVVFEFEFVSPSSVQGHEDEKYLGETWKWEYYDYYYCTQTINLQTQDGFFPIKLMYLNN